jgi:hypothetical protein
MRIALCLSGQPRGLPTNLPYLLEGLIKPSGITDIFIHSWFDESLIGKPFSSAQPHQTGNLGTWLPDTVELLEYLRPKKLLVEKPKEFEHLSHLENLPSAIQTQLASMFYSIYMANKLKSDYENENGFKYDLVIRTRPDCLYYKQHNITDHLADDWKNVLHVPHMYQYEREYKYYPVVGGGEYQALSDTFAYGSSEIIDKFCSVYPNFEEIYNKIRPIQYGEAYCGYQSIYVYNIPRSLQFIEYRLSR